jgi:enoyl-CoA hydratase
MTEWVRYEVPAPGVARITLNRPAQANAQNRHLLYALNDALDRGAQDDEIKVLLIAAEGRHFSSGHDLSGDDDAPFEDVALGPWGGFDAPGHGRTLGAGGGGLLRPVLALAEYS